MIKGIWFIFTTYNYKDGIYTGFTTPTGNTFKTTGTFGTAGYISAWDKYMANIMKPFTSTSTEIKKTEVSAGDKMDEELAQKERDKIALELEKLQAEKDEKRAKAEREEIATQKAKDDYEKTGQTTYKTKDTGGYVTTPNQPATPPTERQGYTGTGKTEYKGRPIGNPMGAQTNKPSKPKSKPRTGPDLKDFR